MTFLLGNLSLYTLVKQTVLDLEISVPEPGEVKKLYETEQIAGIVKPFPFWSRIWHSAIAMSLFLERFPHYVAGKKVLELGAGLAVPSFIASRYAATVTASDYIEEAVDMIALNIDELKLVNIRAELLDWNNLPAGISSDIVLMSDVNYSPRSFDSLFQVIKCFLDTGATIILATPARIVAKSFVDFLMPYIACQELMDISGTEVFIAVLGKKTI